MTKKKSTEEFVSDAVEMFGNTYGYKNVVYNGAKSKVWITCFVHGDWLALPNDHLNGSGCPDCARINTGNRTRKTEDQVRAEIKDVHGETYLYRENLEYKNKNTPIEIFCRKHGWFTQTVHNHVFNKATCRQCSIEAHGDRCRKPLDKFKEDAEAEHGKTYGYDRVNYVNSDTKVEILCYDHGYFWQAPGSHLSGRGCPECAVAGYKNNRPGKLYVLVENDLVKVGITNGNPRVRCLSVSRESGKRFSVLKYYEFEEGGAPRSIETTLLRELREKYKQPTERFDGWKECFYNVNLAALLNRIEELIATQTKEQHSSYPASQEA